MVSGAASVAPAAPYVGYAAISAAYHNIQNIACIDHTKQYFVCKLIKIWLDKSAIIPLIWGFGIGVGNAADGIFG